MTTVRTGSLQDALDMLSRHGGPVFPLILRASPEGPDQVFEGMSMRDYFAARAMAAFIPAGISQEVDDFGSVEIAQESYRYADAMLAERAKGPK